jgi:multiple sugar transport system permease protein
MRKRSLVYTLLLHAVLIVVSLTMIVPFVWMILTAFKTAGEAIQLDPYVFFPTRFQFNSFIRVFTTNNFLNLYKTRFCSLPSEYYVPLLRPAWLDSLLPD